ncbi:hypothetical protein GLOIN_2v1604551, partial [Rhizophagus irregularis DAOM 181602=DAOM 197198]
ITFNFSIVKFLLNFSFLIYFSIQFCIDFCILESKIFNLISSCLKSVGCIINLCLCHIFDSTC